MPAPNRPMKECLKCGGELEIQGLGYICLDCAHWEAAEVPDQDR